MALQKELEIGTTGVKAKYWRVSDDAFLLRSGGLATFRILPYLDQDTRAGGGMPIMDGMREYTLEGFGIVDSEGLPGLICQDGQNPISVAYKRLKDCIDIFSDAIDC